MDQNQKNELIRRVAQRARQKDGGRTHCPGGEWSNEAAFALDLLLKFVPNVNGSNEQIQMMADSVVEKESVNPSNLRRTTFNPMFVHCQPLRWTRKKTQARSANMKKPRVPAMINPGAFVSVKSYTQFCLGMTEDFELKDKTKAIQQEPIQKLFPGETSKNNPSEKPRIVQLSRMLQAELAELDTECVHQCPVVPLGKQNEQDVDVACIMDGAIAANIEYKPTLQFGSFRTQTAVHGTDTMSTFNRPCIVVQIRGMSMETLEIRAYGIVVNLL